VCALFATKKGERELEAELRAVKVNPIEALRYE